MNSITDELKINKRGIISFVGAGGKTTLMYRIAKELSEKGERVLVTTTTKIFPPDPVKSYVQILAKSTKDLSFRCNSSLPHPQVTVAAESVCPKTHKLIGYQPEFIDDLYKTGHFHWILTEADGSARKPIKAPAAHEPVVPITTNYLIGLIGLSALNQPLTCDYVHRTEQFSKITGLPENEKIETNTVSALIVHENGLFKSSPTHAKRIVFLNQADMLPSLEPARLIATQVFNSKVKKPDLIAIGQAKKSPAIFEARTTAAKEQY